MLAEYDRLPTAAVSFSRRNIFKRDHWTCQYCGRQPGGDELTIDHVVPRSQGGVSTWENCVLACIDCNKRKADRTPAQARHEAAPDAGPTGLEAALRTDERADRSAGRSSSARRTGTSRWKVDVFGSAPHRHGACPWALHERAPGRAGGLQNRPTGFDSSRSCLLIR